MTPQEIKEMSDDYIRILRSQTANHFLNVLAYGQRKDNKEAIYNALEGLSRLSLISDDKCCRLRSIWVDSIELECSTIE